jgi:hypothetical protein
MEYTSDRTSQDDVDPSRNDDLFRSFLYHSNVAIVRLTLFLFDEGSADSLLSTFSNHEDSVYDIAWYEGRRMS